MPASRSRIPFLPILACDLRTFQPSSVCGIKSSEPSEPFVLYSPRPFVTASIRNIDSPGDMMSTYCLDFALTTDATGTVGAVASADDLLYSVRSLTGRDVRQLEILCEENHVLVTGVCRDLETKRLVTRAILSAEPGVLVQNEIRIH